MTGRKKLSAVMIAVCMVLTMFVYAIPARAESTIGLYLTSSPEEVHSGDVITVIVTADNMPHVTSFGPVELVYDTSTTEYISTNPSSMLPDFVYTTDTRSEENTSELQSR